MMFTTIFKPQQNEDTFDFAAAQNYATLITNANTEIQIGLFNPLFHKDKIYLHLNKNDIQIKQLSSNPQAKLIFTEILALIPSYWIDPHYGGKATMYYRYLELSCKAKIYCKAEEMANILKSMLKHYQNEGGYDVLTTDSPVYREGLAQLNVVGLEPIKEKTKWKLGQNLEATKRIEIIQKLTQRNLPNDLKPLG